MASDDDELASDEEEILVYVEFEGSIGSNTLSDDQLQLDMVGIDTEHPIMQINGRIYEGTYDNAVGTYMFFSKSDSAVIEDSVFDTPTTLRYLEKTRKLLRMKRVFVQHRTEVLGDSQHALSLPNLTTLAQAGVPVKCREVALQFWTTMRDSRVDALNSYLEKQKIREEKKSRGIELDSESDEDSPFAVYKEKLQTKDMENLKGSNRMSGAGCDAESGIANANNSGNQTSSKPSRNDGKRMALAQKKQTGTVLDARKRKCRRKKPLPVGREMSAEKNDDGLEKLVDAQECDGAGLAASPKVKMDEKHEAMETEQSDFDIDSRSRTDRAAKQLRREAKIQEITERLKTIAAEFSSINVD